MQVVRNSSGPSRSRGRPSRVRIAPGLPILPILLIGWALPGSFAEAQAPSGAPEPGRITGTVLDSFHEMTLPSAPVEVLSTGRVAYSGPDGTFGIRAPAGPQEVRVSFSGYEAVVMAVDVPAGGTVHVEVALTMTRFTEEVEVSAQAGAPELFTAEAQLAERRKAAVIADNLASEEMKRNADSTAASAVRRVAGLTVVDSQYVFVRGLGERYSSTTLNGAVLPTTEPDKRVVPLDLFPTGLIESVSVVKSYLPDKPAEFSGGLVEIDPLSFPTETVLRFSMSQGYNANTTFQDGLAYPGGGRDWLGFDDGTRALPDAVPDGRVTRSSRFTSAGFTPGELERIGESFANAWSPDDAVVGPNQSYSVVAGGSRGRLGAIFSLAYSRDHQTQNEDRRFFAVSEGGLEVQNDYAFDVTTSKAATGLVGNVAYKANDNHRFAIENFYSHNSRNEARTFAGYNNDAATEIRNARLHWVEEGILSSRLSGEHLFPGFAGSLVEWNATVSRATRDEPDLRETLYEFNPSISSFVLADESQSGFRMFNELDDRVRSFGVDWSLFFTQWSGLPASLKFGPEVVFRNRDFGSRRFRMTPRATSGVDLSLSPEEIFTPENIGPFYEIREETRATDAYAAEQTIAAGYGMLDLPASRRLRIIGGVRVERSRQEVDTRNPFAPNAPGVVGTLDDTDLLPGVSVVYALGERANVRAGYSHTVNRPEFRELAPFEFTDVVGGRAVVGNPGLRRALIRNADLRLEAFPDQGEVFAASFFYKRFTDPIERIVQPTAQLRTSFANARGARNFGVELEARKRFGRVSTSANYAWVDSRIELDRTSGQVQTSLDRPLAGQSAHVLNGMLDVSLPEIGGSFRVLYNYFGDRIVDVGSLGLPDIREEGRSALDAVLAKDFGAWSLRASFDNLLDAERLFTQGGERQRGFRLGRSFSLNVSYAVR